MRLMRPATSVRSVSLSYRAAQGSARNIIPSLYNPLRFSSLSRLPSLLFILLYLLLSLSRYFVSLSRALSRSLSVLLAILLWLSLLLFDLT